MQGRRQVAIQGALTGMGGHPPCFRAGTASPLSTPALRFAPLPPPARKGKKTCDLRFVRTRETPRPFGIRRANGGTLVWLPSAGKERAYRHAQEGGQTALASTWKGARCRAARPVDPSRREVRFPLRHRAETASPLSAPRRCDLFRSLPACTRREKDLRALRCVCTRKKWVRCSPCRPIA